jgi:hypothetical protein
MKKYVVRKVVTSFVDYEVSATTDKEAINFVQLDNKGKVVNEGVSKPSYHALTPDFEAEV